MGNSASNSSSGYSTTTRSVATSILQRAKVDDAAAWERLVALFGPDVYQWCRRAGLSADDAEDVVQEVFLSVRRHLPTFHRDKPEDTFRGWLWTITRNKIHDVRHGAANQPAAVGGSGHQQALQQVSNPREDHSDTSLAPGDNRAVVHRALHTIRDDFDPRTWQAFWRMAVDDCSSADVAEELGMTRDAVRQAKCRVMRRLREEMNGLVDL